MEAEQTRLLSGAQSLSLNNGSGHPHFETPVPGTLPGPPKTPVASHTCRMVKFSRTLFIMYFSGRCFSLWMKLIMYSHMGERWMRYTKRPFSSLAYSVCGEPWGRHHSAHLLLAPPLLTSPPLPTEPTLTSTFSTTCLPKEHTLVETLMVMLSAELYWELTP